MIRFPEPGPEPEAPAEAVLSILLIRFFILMMNLSP